MDYDPLSPPKLFEKDAYTLPYSEHECFSELRTLCKQPSIVIGIVRSSFSYVNPHHYLGIFVVTMMFMLKGPRPRTRVEIQVI
jgi:DNA cross-link repair 1B protein